jgi:hypothetical protein
VGEDWDHSSCEGHRLRVYETKTDVRSLPEDLQALLSETLRVVSMTEREAKNLGRQGSSSASSPLPSAGAGSPPSTRTATSEQPLGSSPLPSLTPSLSSAGLT